MGFSFQELFFKWASHFFWHFITLLISVIPSSSLKSSLHSWHIRKHISPFPMLFFCSFTNNQHLDPYNVLVWLLHHKSAFPYLLIFDKWTISCRSSGHTVWGTGLEHSYTGSRVWIPLRAWMFVLVCLCCVGRGLATSWSLVQGVLPYVEDS
jgi:hypothetical protein